MSKTMTTTGLDAKMMVARAAKEEAKAIAAGDTKKFLAWRRNRNLWESRVA